MSQLSKPRNEATARLVWTAIILSFFLIQAAIWSFAISITSNDRSHAVIDGYAEQSMSWDEVKETRLRSRELGWSCDVEVGDVADIRGNRVLRICLTDSHGRPLEAATVEVRAFHCALAGVPQVVDVEESDFGVYLGQIEVSRPGRWRVSGSATRAGEKYLIDKVVSVTGSKE